MEGKWVKHDGALKCPVQSGQKIKVRYWSGDEYISYFPEELEWGWSGNDSSSPKGISEYKVIQEEGFDYIRSKNDILCMMASNIVAGFVSNGNYTWKDIAVVSSEAVDIATIIYDKIHKTQ